MSCEVQAKLVLEIEDEERGYGSWEEGDDIDLVLKNDTSVSGEIMQITENYLIVKVDEDGNGEMVPFDKIKGYL